MSRKTRFEVVPLAQLRLKEGNVTPEARKESDSKPQQGARVQHGRVRGRRANRAGQSGT